MAWPNTQATVTGERFCCSSHFLSSLQPVESHQDLPEPACGICQEDYPSTHAATINTNSQYLDIAVRLPFCNHIIGLQCITKWLGPAEKKNSCPHCRRVFFNIPGRYRREGRQMIVNLQFNILVEDSDDDGLSDYMDERLDRLEDAIDDFIEDAVDDIFEVNRPDSPTLGRRRLVSERETEGGGRDSEWETDSEDTDYASDLESSSESGSDSDSDSDMDWESSLNTALSVTIR